METYLQRYLPSPFLTLPPSSLFLTFEASEDGWTPKELYSKLAWTTPTVLIATADNGAIFGAFTKYKWIPAARGYKPDPSAFLFSLKKNSSYSPVMLKVDTDKVFLFPLSSYPRLIVHQSANAVYVDGKEYPCLKFGSGPDLQLLFGSDKSIIECPGSFLFFSTPLPPISHCLFPPLLCVYSEVLGDSYLPPKGVPIVHNFFTGDPKALLVELGIPPPLSL